MREKKVGEVKQLYYSYSVLEQVTMFYQHHLEQDVENVAFVYIRMWFYLLLFEQTCSKKRNNVK